nr:cytochrome P450 [Tanacetum cinerariifolium]
MHLYDKALEWHKQFLKIHGENMLCPVYEKEIIARFNSVFEDPMVEIKNLKQDGEVKVYQEQFEVLLNRLDLTESYVVSLFIGGLKSEISMPVRMFKPTTLKDASCLTRMQEATLALTKTKHVSQYISQRSNSGTYANRYVTPNNPMTKPVLALPSFSTKNAGKCPGKLYSLEVCVDEFDQVEDVGDNKEIREDNQTPRYIESFPQISLHTLSGVNTFHTMRVKGYVAKKLPCQVTATIPLRVDVANGSKMVHELVDHVSQCCASETTVNIGAAMFTTSLNILSSILFSKDFSQSFSMSSEEFKDAMWVIMEIRGKPNLVDFFLILSFLDLQGLERRGNVYAKNLFSIFYEIIDQRLQKVASSSTCNVLSTKNDVLDLMLDLQL